ncbi:MAG: hypothetical protein WBI53_05730 [Paludibacter sp.]
MKNLSVILLFLVVSFASCKTNDPDFEYTYNTNPRYTWGYAEFFGAYYKDYENSNNVISLSLFSDSLFIDDEGNLDGTGQYLFIEDLFIASTDTILPEGVYSASKSGDPFTFYPGESFGVDEMKYTIGAYIYYIEKNSAFSTIKFIDRGSFTVSNIGSKQNITCNFVLSDSTLLNGMFNAQLPHIDQSATTASNAPRKKPALKHPF